MAGQSKAVKRMWAFLYGMGAAIVILGALFKILHWPGATIMLIIGMGVEAFVFAASSFEPIEDELDWTKVYPELVVSGVVASPKKSAKNVVAPSADDADSLLSKKLDKILKDANLDAKLVSGLGESIKSFQGAIQPLSAASLSISSTSKYNDQMAKAATSMESLNTLYKTQVDNASKQASLNTEMVQETQKLQDQMKSLATNLSSLNGVYGGMLSAMSKK